MSDKHSEPTANPQAPRLSKNEAVRQALKVLGASASRSEIKNYVHNHFGIEMTADRVSTARAEVLSKMMATAKAGKKLAAPQAAPKTEEAPTVAPTNQARPARAFNGKEVRLDDVLTLRKLVDRVGPEELRTLIEVMAK